MTAQPEGALSVASLSASWARSNTKTSFLSAALSFAEDFLEEDFVDVEADSVVVAFLVAAD